MAIVQTMWMTGTKKKLGGTVLYQAMGQTRQRELAAEISNPRTTQQSEYNKFMSLNVASSAIYLPKNVAAAGGCVVNDYIVTQGSLSSIETTKVTGGWASNIFLPAGFQLSASTTIQQLAAAVLPLNPAINEGDQLSFIRMTQQVNGATGVPFVVVRKYEVIISSTDTRLVGSFLPLDYIVVKTNGTELSIGVEDSGNAGGFVLILSRTIGGRTYVSSQRVIVANNTATISYYTGAAALQRAIDSYGESDEPFLTTSTANQNSQASTALSIIGVRVNGQDWAPGSVQSWPDAMIGIQVSLQFNDNITASSAVVTAYGKSNGQVYASDPTAFSIEDDGVYINSTPTEWDGLEGTDAYKIVVSLDGTMYEVNFADHGLD